MKTLGRILIILLAFTIVMGIVYVAVNRGSATTMTGPQQFERRERPELLLGERGERSEREGASWVFGALKNLAVISIVVALIVVPKGWMQRRPRQPQINGT